MDKPADYWVVREWAMSADDIPAALEMLGRAVINAMADDWIPQGGIAITRITDRQFMLFQAMTRNYYAHD